jgi:hypothetical protein
MSAKIGDYMENHGVNFIRQCVPTSLEKPEPDGRIVVKAKYADGTDYTDQVKMSENFLRS